LTFWVHARPAVERRDQEHGSLNLSPILSVWKRDLTGVVSPPTSSGVVSSMWSVVSLAASIVGVGSNALTSTFVATAMTVPSAKAALGRTG
jgi:hypothetical protein